jgi:hypothetical protein
MTRHRRNKKKFELEIIYTSYQKNVESHYLINSQDEYQPLNYE